jgi:polyhydroxybutyrate depolymerase
MSNRSRSGIVSKGAVPATRAGGHPSIMTRGRAIALAGLSLGVAGASLLAVTAVRSGVNRADGEIVSAGEKRSYLLHVPASYDPATPAALVISIHGFADWPAHQMQISRWNDLADRHGFIVVYPGGTGFPKHWRTDGQDMRDVTFIADLLDALVVRFNIDPTRIYANGLSNGGGMSYLLACRLAHRVAAVGSVSGAYLLPLSACTPARPVPLIAFHGTADRIVPYNGGPSGPFHFPFPTVPDWIAAYASRNGCDAVPAALLGHGEVSGVQYASPEGGADVVFYTIKGGGHSWPGGGTIPRFIVGHTTRDIDATGAMWDFFSRHPLPASPRDASAP